MSQSVFVITPSGTSFLRTFADGVTPAQILAQLRSPASKRLIGYAASARRADPAFGQVVPCPDPASGYAVDHPLTRIVLGTETDDGRFLETVTLAGPPAPVPAPTQEPATTPA